MNRFWNCLIVFGLAALVLAARLPAQDPVTGARLSGPVLGFVDDADAGIRPMLGVPGSAFPGLPCRCRAGSAPWLLRPFQGSRLPWREIGVSRSLFVAWRMRRLSRPSRVWRPVRTGLR